MGLSFSTNSKGEIGELTAGWSVSESATPVVVGQTMNATNTAQFSGESKPGSVFLVDKSGTITHVSERPDIPSLGSVTGDLQSVQIGGAGVSVSQNSLMTKLNVDRTTGPLVGGVQSRESISATSKNGDYGSFGITAVKATRDGAFIYVYSRVAATGNLHYLTKIDSKTGARVWRISVSPVATYKDSMVVDDLGRISIIINERVGGSTGYNSAMNTYSADGILLLARTDLWIATNWNGFNQFRDISYRMVSDRVGNIYVGATAINTGQNVSAPQDSGGTGYLQKITPGVPNSTWDAVQRAWVNYARTPAESIGYKSQGVWWLSGNRFLAYGPILPYDAPGITWAIYNTKPWADQTSSGDGGFSQGITRARFIESSYTPDFGVTMQDDAGNFFIGDRQYDTDGNQVQSFEGVRRAATDPYNQGLPWQVISVTSLGEVIFMAMPNGNTATPSSVLQFSFNYTSMSLSRAISKYIGLIFGVSLYPIVYQGASDPTIILPGWTGNLLDYLTQLLVAYKLEMVLINGQFVFRPVGTEIIEVSETEVSPSLSSSVVGNSRRVGVSYNLAQIVSGSGRAAANLVNLSTNPRAFLNTSGYVGMVDDVLSGNVYRVNSAQEAFSGFSVGNPGPDPAFSSGVHVLYGQYTINGRTYGSNKRMGLTQGVTYIVTAVINVNEAQRQTPRHPNARSFGVRLSKPDGSYKYFWSQNAPNVRGYYQYSVEFYFDPDYDDASILFMVGVPGGYNVGAGAVNFGPVRITPKGLETPEFPDDSIYYGGQSGWQWTGAAHNSTSQLAIPATTADNLIYSARNDDNRTFSVNARGRETTTLTLDTYPTFLSQPYPTNNLSESAGSYYVSAKDNLPVQAAQWLAYGGRVEVSIGAEPNQIDVLLVGPTADIPGVPGPYKLAASDDKNDYAFFSIVGSGVRVERREITVGTGVEPAKITREDSGVVDNFAVRTIEQAYDLAYSLADSMGAASVTYELTVPLARLSKFGATPGSIISAEDAIYRVRDVRIGNAKVTLTCERFTSVDQVIALYENMTVDQVIAFWDGYTVHDAILRPLRPLT